MGKKILFISIVSLIICVIMYNVIFVFFGLPFGEYIAKNVVQKYLSNQYPTNTFMISDIHYNNKNTEYLLTVSGKNPEIFIEIKYLWQTNSIVDSKYSKDMNTMFVKDINEKLNREYMDMRLIHCLIIPRIKLPLISKQKFLLRDDIVYFVFENATNDMLQKDEFAERIMDILVYLKEKNYQVYKLDVTFMQGKNDKKAVCLLNLSRNQLINISKEEMKKLIVKPEEDYYNYNRALQ